MDYSWLGEKILPGLIIVGAVTIAILRFAGGLAAAPGLGRFPMAMIPARLRRFLYGEPNDAAHKPRTNSHFGVPVDRVLNNRPV